MAVGAPLLVLLEPTAAGFGLSSCWANALPLQQGFVNPTPGSKFTVAAGGVDLPGSKTSVAAAAAGALHGNPLSKGYEGGPWILCTSQ